MTLCISQTDPWQQIQQVTVYVKQGVELTNKADRGTDPSQLLIGEEVDRMARGQAAQTHNIPVQKYTTKNPQVTTTINKQNNNTYNVK